MHIIWTMQVLAISSLQQYYVHVYIWETELRQQYVISRTKVNFIQMHDVNIEII